MKPSCFRTSRIRMTSLEYRISTAGCRARDPLRILVSASPIVSLLAMSPARFHEAGDFPAPGHFSEAHAAEAEPPVVAAAPGAALAAVDRAHLELGRPFRAFDPRFPCHSVSVNSLSGPGARRGTRRPSGAPAPRPCS